MKHLYSPVVCGFGPHLHNQLDQVIYDCVCVCVFFSEKITQHALKLNFTQFFGHQRFFYDLNTGEIDDIYAK